MLVLFKCHIVLSLYFPSRDHAEALPSTTYLRLPRISIQIVVYSKIRINGHFSVALIVQSRSHAGQSRALPLTPSKNPLHAIKKVPTTLNIFLRFPLTLLYCSLEIIAKIPREYLCS